MNVIQGVHVAEALDDLVHVLSNKFVGEACWVPL